MARKGQQKRVIGINVTEAQWQAVQEALAIAQSKAPKANRNDILLVALVAFCDTAGIEWPEYISRQGKRTDLEDNS